MPQCVCERERGKTRRERKVSREEREGEIVEGKNRSERDSKEERKREREET